MIHVAGLAALALVVGGAWWYVHDRHEHAQISRPQAMAMACPALDTALLLGRANRTEADQAFDRIEKSRDLDPQLRTFVQAGRQVLNGSRPQDLPRQIRARVTAPCASAGHPLTQLSAR